MLPLLLLGMKFQVLPIKHLESAIWKELTLKYSDPGYVTLEICQFPLIPDCEVRSSFGVGLVVGALDLQANNSPIRTGITKILFIIFNFKILQIYYFLTQM